MLNRIRGLIEDHREGTALVLISFGILWLMGVAGADDFNTARHIFTPILPLMIKSAFGLLIMAIGTKILKGGDQREGDC